MTRYCFTHPCFSRALCPNKYFWNHNITCSHFSYLIWMEHFKGRERSLDPHQPNRLVKFSYKLIWMHVSCTLAKCLLWMEHFKWRERSTHSQKSNTVQKSSYHVNWSDCKYTFENKLPLQNCDTKHIWHKLHTHTHTHIYILLLLYLVPKIFQTNILQREDIMLPVTHSDWEKYIFLNFSL
jgi:hypothetical protein